MMVTMPNKKTASQFFSLVKNGIGQIQAAKIKIRQVMPIEKFFKRLELNEF